MKHNFTFALFFAAFLAVLTTDASAQANATNTQIFQLKMTLDVDQTAVQPMGNVKLIGTNVYIASTSNNTTPTQPNGLLTGYNGLMRLTNGSTSSPQRVGNGIPLTPGYGALDITGYDDNHLWVIAQLNGTMAAYAYEPLNGVFVQRNITSDTTINFIENINDSTNLLIGRMKYVNGVLVNGICKWNTNTDAITPVASGFTNPSNVPVRVTRSKDGKQLAIGGRNGLSTYNIETDNFTEQPTTEPSAYPGFIVHGDTMYACGEGMLGSSVYKKIGSGNWELIGYAPFAQIHSINFLAGGKVAFTGSYSYFTLSDGTGVDGNSLIYNELTEKVETSPVGGLDAVRFFLALPNGEYIGWAHGGNIFGTESLVSGIENISTTKVKMYPNPANNFVTIEGVPAGKDIIITDVLGRTELIATSIGTSTTISTETLPAGMHFANGNRLAIE